MPQGLFLDPDGWQNLKQRLSDPFFATLHANNEKALAILGQSPFWEVEATLGAGGERNPWNWRILKHRLVRAAVSWRLAAQPASRAMALEAVDQLLDRSLWKVQFAGSGLHHADLKTGDLAFCACFAREALAGELGPSRDAQLTAMLADWFLPAYLRGIDEREWWRHAEFNWGAAVHGAAGLAALSLRDTHPALAQRALAEARDGLQFVIDAYPEGGGWIEGIMYQATTLAHLTDFAAALHRLTGDDLGLSTHRRFLQNIDFRMAMLGGDGLPLNFSNCNARSNEWRCPHVYWWANRCNRPDWTGFEDAHQRDWRDTNGVFLDLEAFWLREPGQPSTPPAPRTGLEHFRGIDWAAWRRGGAWLGFRSGTTGGNHTNRDLGQIIFGIQDRRVLLDPGYLASAAHQHNCLALRKLDQAAAATARLFRAREIPGTTTLHLACDLTEVHPHILNFHYRHVLASPKGWLLIVDDLLARHGLRAGAAGHLQLPAAPELHEGGFRLQLGHLNLRGHWLGATRPGRIDSWEWDNQPIHTLTYHPRHDHPSARVAVLLTPTDQPAHWREDGFHCRFEHAGETFDLDLAEALCRPATA